MKTEGTTESITKQRKDLRTRCPFCLTQIDVNLDRRDRPYWVCMSCQTRTFASRTALEHFTNSGWIWTDEPPLEALKEWLERVMVETGLKKKRKQ